MSNYHDTFPSVIQSAEAEGTDLGEDVLYMNHTVTPFTAVLEEDDDKKTTEADLGILNNALAIQCAALLRMNSVESTVKLVGSIYKGIELRRKVKKLALGSTESGAKTWDMG